MYDVNTLTVNGLALLAGASAANRLIYTRMLTSEDAFTAEEAAVAEISDFDGPEGSISTASATDNVARIIGAVRNATASEVSLKTFALCGRLENSIEDEVMLVISDASASVILPPAGGPDAAASVAFSLVLAAGESAMVTVTPAGSASIADLARFVSAHKAGDTEAGDDQTVYGEKTFHNDIYADGGIHASGEIYGNSVQVGTVRANAEGYFGSDVYITGGGISCDSIEPYTDQGVGVPVGSVGSSSHPYNSVYVGQLIATAGRLYMPIAGSVQYAGSLEFSRNSAVNQTDLYGGEARLLLNTAIDGSSSYINLTVDGQKGLLIEYGASLQDYVLSITTARAVFTGQLVTFSQDTAVAINGEATVNELSVNALTGIAPTYNPITSTRILSPGSIVMAWAHISGGTLGVLHCGERFRNTGADDLFYFAQNSGGMISSSNVKIPAGLYAVLCDVNATNTGTWFFVQCLSLDE